MIRIKVSDWISSALLKYFNFATSLLKRKKINKNSTLLSILALWTVQAYHWVITKLVVNYLVIMLITKEILLQWQSRTWNFKHTQGTHLHNNCFHQTLKQN